MKKKTQDKKYVQELKLINAKGQKKVVLHEQLLGREYNGKKMW